jgi:hypothetical protein
MQSSLSLPTDPRSRQLSCSQSSSGIMSNRFCSSCGRNLHRESYTNHEWSKGIGISRCGACAHQSQSFSQGIVDGTKTARINDAHHATFEQHELDNPFANGAFRWVAKGKYTEGNRAGEQCVCKWFKTGGVMESHFYDTDLKAADEAIRMVTLWNSEKFIDRMVRVNKPEVWTFLETCQPAWAGKKVLQEPFINDYQKFNSNTGWSDDSIPWSRVMQALSHFSYHVSSGQTLLCDLQGGVYRDGVILTDPVVMSQTKGTYGPTDLGTDGISTFFYHHKCNEFCKMAWQKPQHRAQYYARTAGTTMEHVPTRHSRNHMSAMSTLRK